MRRSLEHCFHQLHTITQKMFKVFQKAETIICHPLKDKDLLSLHHDEIIIYHFNIAEDFSFLYCKCPTAGKLISQRAITPPHPLGVSLWPGVASY